MEDDFYAEDDERTYENYNGSYAQDVEGWSDQDIDDAFDGDPDAYWNIDEKRYEVQLNHEQSVRAYIVTLHRKRKTKRSLSYW